MRFCWGYLLLVMHLLSKELPLAVICHRPLGWPSTCRPELQMKTFVSTPLTLRVSLPGVYGDLNLHLWSIKCCNRGIEASQYLSPIQGVSHLSAKQEDLGSFSLLGLFRYFRELHFSLHWRAGGLCSEGSWKSEGQRLKLLFFAHLPRLEVYSLLMEVVQLLLRYAALPA